MATVLRPAVVVVTASLIGPAAAAALALWALATCPFECHPDQAAASDALLWCAGGALLLASPAAGLLLRSWRAAGAVVLGQLLVLALGGAALGVL